MISASEIKGQPAFTFRINKLDDLESVVPLLDGIFPMHIKKEIQFIIRVIIDEICVNFCKHSNCNEDPNIFQVVMIMFSNNNVLLSFKDNGPKFDITKAPSVEHTFDLPITQRPIGKLGIHIVKHFADNITYEYKNHTNEITIMKKNYQPKIT